MPQSMSLSALMSQAWVAFTVEVDNAFEARMPHSTTRGRISRGGPWLVSHAMWWTCMRYVDASGLTVAELEACARTRTNLQGMIRWGYVTLASAEGAINSKRPRKDTIIRATPKGLLARELWPDLQAEVQQRWNARMGNRATQDLGDSLKSIANDLEPGLPDCLPILGYGFRTAEPITGPVGPVEDSIQPLLARALISFTLEYERRERISLAIGSNLLRLIEGQEIPVRELPTRAGVSKEAVAGMVSFLERGGMAEVRSRGGVRIMTLTSSGADAQKRYRKQIEAVESRWCARFRSESVVQLRKSLEAMALGAKGLAFLTQATTPPANGWRARAGVRNWPWQPMVLHRGGYPDGS
jgi:predicted transcriptional regulator